MANSIKAVDQRRPTSAEERAAAETNPGRESGLKIGATNIFGVLRRSSSKQVEKIGAGKKGQPVAAEV